MLAIKNVIPGKSGYFAFKRPPVSTLMFLLEILVNSSNSV